MMRAFLALIARDVALAVRVGGGGGMAVFFFLVVVAIVPLGIGPNLVLLGQIAPGLLWVALLLSSLLTLDRLFQADYEDGTLDILSMGTLPLELTACAKIIAHWLTTGLPLVVAAPLLGLLRSDEHTSELQSLMRISYAVFCLKKKNKQHTLQHSSIQILKHHII